MIHDFSFCFDSSCGDCWFLWTIFIRVILPLGLIVLLGMGVYWVYEKIASPKEEKVIIQQVPQEPQSIIPDVFIAPAEKI